MKDRHHLAAYFYTLGFTKGAEVGVLGGGYSLILCNSNPNLKLYCVDSWGLGDGRYTRYHLRKYEEAKIRLKDCNVVLVRKPSLAAVQDFEKGELDFVYIDASHSFDNIMRDIIEWTRKIRRGGIVSGHDYSGAVKDAVDVYPKWPRIKLEVTRVRTKGSRSWWFFV